MNEMNLCISSVAGAGERCSQQFSASPVLHRASLAGIVSAISYPTRGLSLPTLQHSQSPRDKLPGTFPCSPGQNVLIPEEYPACQALHPPTAPSTRPVMSARAFWGSL